MQIKMQELADEVASDVAAAHAKVLELESRAQLGEKLSQVCRLAEGVFSFSAGLEKTQKLQQRQLSALRFAAAAAASFPVAAELTQTTAAADRLSAKTLLLQEQTLLLQQQALAMQREYEALQSSTIRELCRCVCCLLLCCSSSKCTFGPTGSRSFGSVSRQRA